MQRSAPTASIAICQIAVVVAELPIGDFAIMLVRWNVRCWLGGDQIRCLAKRPLYPRMQKWIDGELGRPAKADTGGLLTPPQADD